MAATIPRCIGAAGSVCSLLWFGGKNLAAELFRVKLVMELDVGATLFGCLQVDYLYSAVPPVQTLVLLLLPIPG